MKIYVIIATGRMKFFDDKKQMICKTAFKDKNAAIAHQDTFKKVACEDNGGLTEFDPRTVNTTFIELELME